MRPFNPWASYLMQGQQPSMGILGQDFGGMQPVRRLPPPGPGIGIGLRPMPDPGMPEANLPGTADRMPQFGAAAPSAPTWMPPLGGRGMPTMLPNSPPLFEDENRGVTPQANTGSGTTPLQSGSAQTPPFDVADYLRRLYAAAAGVGQ
jgi:hypothetical protein